MLKRHTGMQEPNLGVFTMRLEEDYQICRHQALLKRCVLACVLCILGIANPIFGIYTLLPGDTLDIKVVGHEELTAKQVITPDGTISVPLIGRVVVQNKTLPEIDTTLTNGFAKYIKSPQVATFLVPKEAKTEEFQYFVVLHDLKKDDWQVKSVKTSSEAWAWTNGRSYELLRSGQKIDSKDLQPGDSLLVSYSKAPDFWEENWYKVLTAMGVVTGIYLGLSK